MSTTAEISEPASELERLIAELSGPGLRGVFDCGVDCHLAGVTTPDQGGRAAHPMDPDLRLRILPYWLDGRRWSTDQMVAER